MSSNSARPGSTMRAGLEICNILLRAGHKMPEGARKNIIFLLGEAYSYGPNVLADLDQAIQTKASAALKVIIANVPIIGPASMGVILDEGSDLALSTPSADSYTGLSPHVDENELQEKLEKLGLEIEKLTTKNQVLEVEAANLTEKLREAQGEVVQLRTKNRILEMEAARLHTPVEPVETNPDNTVSLVSDVSVLDAIGFVAPSRFLKNTNQYMRCSRICEVAKKDNDRGRPFTKLAGIIQGIRDGTFDQWVSELQDDGILSHKSAGPFHTFASFVMSSGGFGDGSHGVSMARIRSELEPLLRKRGYDIVLPKQ